MSDTIRCNWCGKFVSVKEAVTYYPPTPIDAMEPTEPVCLCKKCSVGEEQRH